MRRFRGSRSRPRSSRGHVRMEPGFPWTRWIAWVVFVVAVLVVIVVVVRRLILPMFEDNEKSYQNRTWLAFDPWVKQPADDTAIRQLAQFLEEQKIDTVYLEAAIWYGDGTLSEGLFAADFAGKLRAEYPAINILLWLRMSGEQIVEENWQIEAIRVANEAVRQWGFDGVQLNGVRIVNRNPDYLQLLFDLRTAIGSDKLLSITVPPDRVPADPEVPVGLATDTDLTWEVAYKQEVGDLLVDEVVVMAHGSGLEAEEDYELWVAYQVASYATALAELRKPVEIIVALPTYEAGPGHDPVVEGLLPSIRGVRAGIERAGKAGKWVKGVGIYVYETTDTREWGLYREHWLGLEPG